MGFSGGDLYFEWLYENDCIDCIVFFIWAEGRYICIYFYIYSENYIKKNSHQIFTST